MPTYEYVCKKCKHRFEEFQNIKDKPLTACPVKGCTGKVKRIISSGAGVLFKGSGFYGTDYRSESYKKAANAETGSSPAQPSTGSSDTKSSKESKKDSSPSA
jgi:putative FmdB family regulatory protein